MHSNTPFLTAKWIVCWACFGLLPFTVQKCPFVCTIQWCSYIYNYSYSKWCFAITVLSHSTLMLLTLVLIGTIVYKAVTHACLGSQYHGEMGIPPKWVRGGVLHIPERMATTSPHLHGPGDFFYDTHLTMG